MRRHLLRGLAFACSLALLVLVVVAVWGYLGLRASLAQLDGNRTLPGLWAPVEVARDALGVPAVRAQSRRDAALATGFLHAQDRFFQMDLARRQAAGELAELVGPAAIMVDREMRRHRFRAVAREAVARLRAADRVMLDAYVDGLNAGLAALRAAPPEYTVLRQTPRPWAPEDSLLIVLAMFLTLQDSRGDYESTLGTLYDVLPREMADFLAPPATEWDAPVAGRPEGIPPIPGPDIYDLRTRRDGRPAAPRRTGTMDSPPGTGTGRARGWWAPAEADQTVLGSNNWAVAGHLTAGAGPLVANDAHLTVRVPNTWYRIALEWPGETAADEANRLVGVTLPGLPNLVVGSNTHVAWGFTNTYADWSDIVLLEIHPDDPNRYRTPDGWREFSQYEEIIAVAGEAPRHDTVIWTIWGPMIGPDYRGRPRALRWVAHDAGPLAARLLPLEGARTLDEAFASAHGAGAPGQNLVAADRDGRIGWTVYGSLPRREGIDGRRPASWADGSRGWQGWLDPSAYPRIVDPPGGRLWTANARVVGDAVEGLVDGGYDIGARASIIRDRLRQIERATPADMLAIQLDTAADFLARWRDLLLETLSPDVVRGRDARARLRGIVADRWEGRALPESAAYRLTRAFREEVSARVAAFVVIECVEADPGFDYRRIRNREGPIWALVSARPPHLLDPRYETWHDLLVEAADAVIEDGRNTGADLAARTWGAYNMTAYRHPLSAQLPFVSRWLDMPYEPLPGDAFTVRVQWQSIAASMRMVVSPGHEADGILQMPTGQSGHPLSPFYANSHPAWVDGEPTPLLPGEPVHRLVLVP